MCGSGGGVGELSCSLLTRYAAGAVSAGGVREAYKGKGEEYQLFWPEKKKSGGDSRGGWRSRLPAEPCLPRTPRHGLCHLLLPLCAFTRLALITPLLPVTPSPQAPPALGALPLPPSSPPRPPLTVEFIRMAARFGATIVPFAGVGIDDSLEVLLDSSELENLPVVGDYVRRQAGRLPQVRCWPWAARTQREEGEQGGEAGLGAACAPPVAVAFRLWRGAGAVHACGPEVCRRGWACCRRGGVWRLERRRRSLWPRWRCRASRPAACTLCSRSPSPWTPQTPR